MTALASLVHKKRPLDSITKRDGRQEPFTLNKIRSAVNRCFSSIKLPEGVSSSVAGQVTHAVENILQRSEGEISVEGVQRLIIQQLWVLGYFEAAEAYTLYREQRRKQRETKENPALTAIINEDAKHFPSPLQYLQFLDKYARWDDTQKRRETWRECCTRVMAFFKKQPQLTPITESEWEELDSAMYNQQASPAMRVVQMAGPSLDRCNTGAFNCSYVACDDLVVFSETLYLLMQGCGVGFSVESEYVDQLPRIRKQRGKPAKIILVGDSTEGWCDALKEAILLWVDGYDAIPDVSLVRPHGARLKTKGGRASGPQPFLNLFNFARGIFLKRQGSRLSPRDCHDLLCMVGKIVQMGGVRRASEISLSDLDDVEMRDIKSGNWWEKSPWLDMANNCLPLGTMIYTTRGNLPIEQIVAGDVVTTVAGKGRVKARADSGVQETLLIEHNFGVFECTPNHRVAVFDSVHTWKFKKAKDITTRDALVFDQLGFDGVVTQLPQKIPYKATGHNKRNMIVPDLSTEMAWLIGVFQGDGNTGVSNKLTSFGQPGYGGVTVACNKTNREAFTRLHKSLGCFGIPTKDAELASEWGSCDNVYANSVELALYFREYVKKSKTPMDVPSWILQGTKRVRAAYLAGILDSDGSISTRPIVVAFSVYKSFLEQVRTVVTSLGIASKLTEATKRYGNSQLCHNLSVWGVLNRRLFDALVGQYSSRYNQAKPYFPNRSINEFSFPIEIVEDSGIRTPYMQGDRQSVDHLMKVSDFKPVAMPLMVRSVKPSGRSAQTFDLEVEDIHQFTANGLVVHNSAVYQERPDSVTFMEEWLALARSGCGERGIFNRGGIQKQIPKRRKRAPFGINPCGEVILRSSQMCNLSIVVARHDDTPESLERKVRWATYFGTLQCTLTNFSYVRKIWADNCNEERLLGVDLNGQMDCPLLRPGADGRQELLDHLLQVVLATHNALADRLDINRSAATTVVKPSGNSAAFFGCSSGMHARWSKHQVRRIRLSRYGPMAALLVSEGVPHNIDPMNDTLLVFDFLPDPAPDGTPTRNDMTAVQQFHNWLEWKQHWTEHNPSQTIYVGPDEWLELGAEVYKHFDSVGGITFLPRDSGTYQLAPNEELTEEDYTRRREAFPVINWGKLSRFEQEDMTTQLAEAACSGGSCDLL